MLKIAYDFPTTGRSSVLKSMAHLKCFDWPKKTNDVIFTAQIATYGKDLTMVVKNHLDFLSFSRFQVQMGKHMYEIYN